VGIVMRLDFFIKNVSGGVAVDKGRNSRSQW